MLRPLTRLLLLSTDDQRHGRCRGAAPIYGDAQGSPDGPRPRDAGPRSGDRGEPGRSLAGDALIPTDWGRLQSRGFSRVMHAWMGLDDTNDWVSIQSCSTVDIPPMHRIPIPPPAADLRAAPPRAAAARIHARACRRHVQPARPCLPGDDAGRLCRPRAGEGRSQVAASEYGHTCAPLGHFFSYTDRNGDRKA